LFLVVQAVVRVGRKYAVYLPRRVVEELKLREGEKLVLTLEGESIVLRRPTGFFEEARQPPQKVAHGAGGVRENQRGGSGGATGS